MNRRNWIRGVLGIGAASSIMAIPAAAAPTMDIFERINDLPYREQARILKAALRLNPELAGTQGFIRWAAQTQSAADKANEETFAATRAAENQMDIFERMSTKPMPANGNQTVAQVAEHSVWNREVEGSWPSCLTKHAL